MAFREDDKWGGSFWRRLVKAPVGWLRRFSREDKIGHDKPFLMLAWEFVTLPFRALLAFAVFMVVSWSTTRVGRQFIFGFPALIVAAGFLGAIWVDQYLGE